MNSPHVVWQDTDLTRWARWKLLGTTGATVWLTGLPAAGKSTIGAALEARLVAGGRHAYLLDGDNLRHGICGDLGFSAEDRARNIARAGELARLFADSGSVSIVALVSPLARARDAVRDLHVDAGLRFVEVLVDTPVDVCAARDPKALYARARAGEIQGFTGVDDAYERPSHPDLVVPGGTAVSVAVDAVLNLLDGDFPPAADSEHPRPGGRGQPLAGATPAGIQNGVQI